MKRVLFAAAAAAVPVAAAVCIVAVSLGARVQRWETLVYLGSVVAFWGTALLWRRTARTWEGTAGTWKDIAMRNWKLYEDLHGDSMRLLTAARREDER